MGEKDHVPVERFDPLLRDLVAWGLVTATPDTTAGRGTAKASWRLTDAAQRRLSELVKPTRPLNPDQLVYLDHHCARCRVRGRTRLRDGLYLCDDCLARDGGGPPPPSVRPVPESAPRLPKGHWRRPRHRDDPSKPLAG